jgi:hypothetical protein
VSCVVGAVHQPPIDANLTTALASVMTSRQAVEKSRLPCP